MTLITEKNFIDSEAPTLYDAGRQCEKCNSKLSRYTTPYIFQKPERKVLLCSPCDYARRYTNLDPLEYVGKKKTKVKPAKERHYSPTLGIFLPGLFRVRTSRGMVRNVLAGKVGCSQGHLYDLEAGRRRASKELAGRLARELGVSYEELQELQESELEEAS